MLRVCVFSALVPALCAAAPPRDEYLYLNSFFDVDGFAPGGRGPEGNLGGTGTSFPASGLPEGRTVQVHSTRFGKVTFLRPQTDGNKKNMIAADGQKIRVRTSKVFNTLFVLGTAHHGGHAGWVEFEFEGGEKGRGPLAFSDWYAVADFGEEEAFTARSPTGNPFGNKVRLFLQYTPIPRARKLRSITLPELPRVKITALTLGWRDGVEPIEPRRPDPVEPAPVAIFSEPAFPYSHAVRRIAPEALAEGFRRVGIPTALLNVEQLAEPRIFNSKSFPVLVHPYGRVFPHAAADALRRFRSEGGISVHTGPPFTVAAVKSPYGGWTYLRKSSRDTGKVTDFIDPGKPGYLGSGQAREGGGAPLEATDLLRSWGLGGIDWKDFRAHHGWTRAPFPFAIDRASLPTGAEVRPLLTYGPGGLPFAAVVLHKNTESPFHRAVDVWIGCQRLWAGERQLSPAFWTELVVRGAAWALKRSGKIDDATWARAAGPLDPGVALSPPARLVAAPPGRPYPVPKPLPETVHVIRAAELPVADRLLLSSAQGLLRQAGKHALYVVDGAAAESALRAVRKSGAVKKTTDVEFPDVFRLLGHRRAVLVDPFLFGSLNVATLIAAQEGLLVAYPHQVATHGLEVAVDLRGLFEDGGEMLRWTYEHLWPRFEKNLLCVYPPVAEAYELRDYIITNKIFTLWIPSFQDRSNRGARPREELEVVERMLSEAPISIPVIGRLGDGRILGHTQENGLAFLSQFGKYFVPLDVAPRSVPPVGLSNLSVLSALPEKKAAGERRARRELEVERDKIYIAVLNRPLDPASLLATSPSAGETTQLPGDVALAESLEPGALLDLAPGLVQRLLRGGGKPRAIDGASGPGLVHFGRLGDRYGDARQAVSRAYFAELASFQRRHGLRFVTQTSSGRFRQDMESSGLADLMPETAIFVSYSAEETVNPLTATYRLGKAVVFHDVGPAVLGSYFSGTAGAAVYKRFLPAFLATTATSLSLDIADGKELPDDIVFVSFEELVELYRRWSERRRLVSFEFVRQGAAWKYHDGGEDLGRAWRQPSYNDSRWSTGKSELGYGDSSSPKPEATVISWGSNASSKHPCYYFRRTFEYDPSSPARFLLLEVIRDDGCVVYLNGKEVLRDNLPEGEIAHDTMAQRTIGSAEEYTWVPATIDGSLLRRGKNTVAVEMHQATPNSSDLSFDLRLSGYRYDVPGENR